MYRRKPRRKCYSTPIVRVDVPTFVIWGAGGITRSIPRPDRISRKTREVN